MKVLHVYKKRINKKIFILFLLSFFLGILFLKFSYFSPKFDPRDISPGGYSISINDQTYRVLIKRRLVPINYKNSDEEFLKPYVQIKKIGRENKNTVLFLSGGPVEENLFLLGRNSKKVYYEIIKEYIQTYFLALLEEKDVIFIDDRVNDLFNPLSCEAIELSWRSYVNRSYRQLSLSCEKSNEYVRESLSDFADIKDIKAILNAEKIEEVDVIGVSFGAWRGLNFINEYPQKVKSFSSIYGDIFRDSYEDKSEELLKRLDVLSSDPQYQWPFSVKPSLVAKKFNVYLKNNLNFIEYYQQLFDALGSDILPYIPNKELFDLLLRHSVKSEISSEEDMIYFRVLDAIRGCERGLYYQQSEKQSPINYLSSALCSALGDNNQITKNFHISPNIPVQIIQGGLDTIGQPPKYSPVLS